MEWTIMDEERRRLGDSSKGVKGSSNACFMMIKNFVMECEGFK